MPRFLLVLALTLTPTLTLSADEWPQWLGPKRDGVWRETGIIDTFPAGGPKKLWSVPVGAGYAGPAFFLAHIMQGADQGADMVHHQLVN